MILAMDSLVAPRHGHFILFEFIAQALGGKRTTGSDSSSTRAERIYRKLNIQTQSLVNK